MGNDVILEDFTGNSVGFNTSTSTGMIYAQIDAISNGSPTLTVSINSNKSPFNDANWVPADGGSIHIPSYRDTSEGIYNPVYPEVNFINSLMAITGAASIPITGSTTVNGIFVGETSQFDSNTATDPFAYNKLFDNESELGQTGYIVDSNGGNLYLVGGPNGNGSGESDAMDAFLQNIGMEQYGPQNNFSGDGSPQSPNGYGVTTGSGGSIYEKNVWQITPNYDNSTGLTGSWDIRQVPSIGYLENDYFGNGAPSGNEKPWTNFMLFNMGGGFPFPVVTQGTLGVSPNTTNLYAHPDWWSSIGNVLSNNYTGLTSPAAVATVGVTAGTINSGDLFTITLNDSGTKESVTVTANSTDDTASGIANALSALISTSGLSYFDNMAASVTTTADDLWVGNATSGYWAANVPVVEFYLKNSVGASYTVTTTTTGTATIQAGVTMITNTVNGFGELNFTNLKVITHVLDNYVSNWLASQPLPGSMNTMSPSDGGDYDESASTEYLMHSNNPYQDSSGSWWGYNQNGVLVAADSESYLNLVNQAALEIRQSPLDENYYVGALAYSDVSQPPSFPLQPNVYLQVSEAYDRTSLTMDQQLKSLGQKGALTGVYKDWAVYDFAGQDGEPATADLDTSSIESDWKIYNNDHVTAIGGESNDNYGPGGLSYYLGDVLNSDTSLVGTTTLQTTLTNFYNNSFGPAATPMEDYFVMFNGTSADPNLAGPPAQVTFDGNAMTFNSLSQANAAVVSDAAILTQAFGYFNTADTDLTTAYNNGNSGSITTTQYAADQARVDQLRMYVIFLYDQYKVELDYNAGGYTNNSQPGQNSPSFNALLNDLVNETLWVDNLAFAEEVDAQAYQVWYAVVYGDLWRISKNDPAGSNGLGSAGFGLLQEPSSTAFTYFESNPTDLILINNSPTQSTLNSTWDLDETDPTLGVAPPSNLVATTVANATIDVTWTDNDSMTATAYDIDRSTTSSGGFSQIGTTGTVGASASNYTDTSLTAGTTYYYEVDAVTAATTSAFSNVATPTPPVNENGGIVTDYWYDNGNSTNNWVGQWTQTNQTAHATPAIKYNSSNQGKAKFTKISGTMSGNYLANINTVNYVDSNQSVLVSSDTLATGFELAARTALTSDAHGYFADLTWNATSSKANLEIKVGATVIGSLATAMAITTAPTYDLEFEVVTVNSTTTDLYAKVWNITSATEPTTWQVTAVDTTGSLQNGNSSNVDGMNFLLANTSENTFVLDNYEQVNIVTSNASYIDNFQNSSTTGWSPLTASRWTVGTQGNATNGYSVRYYINTSSYAEGANSTLGEYSLLGQSGFTDVGDFTMTLDAAAASTTAGSNYAIVFGYQDANDYYFMEFNATSGATKLYKVVGGAAPVSIGTTVGGQIIDTNYHAIKIQRIGTSISVWYDGVNILTTTDATFVGGQIGIGALNDAAYFDNVIVG